jgi:hypothetical protein
MDQTTRKIVNYFDLTLVTEVCPWCGSFELVMAGKPEDCDAVGDWFDCCNCGSHTTAVFDEAPVTSEGELALPEVLLQLEYGLAKLAVSLDGKLTVSVRDNKVRCSMFSLGAAPRRFYLQDTHHFGGPVTWYEAKANAMLQLAREVADGGLI